MLGLDFVGRNYKFEIMMVIHTINYLNKIVRENVGREEKEKMLDGLHRSYFLTPMSKNQLFQIRHKTIILPQISKRTSPARTDLSRI